MALILLLHPRSGFAQEGSAAPIEDNSFLIEEAYNQEPGIVQHISTFMLQENQWVYSFTQEWPVWSQKHQFSFTIPVQRVDENGVRGTGIGDIALNYRYQIGGMDGDVAAFAPRVSILLPTGDADEGRGSGTVGYQVNLPVSVASSEVAAHFNAGMTYLPADDGSASVPTSSLAYTVGQSVIWLLRPNFNLLTEALWTNTRLSPDAAPNQRTNSVLISPGFRGAINFDSGLQVVPGAAVAFEVAHEADPMLVLYLSFEHPFGRRQ